MAGDGGRVPDVSEQRAEKWLIRVCEHGYRVEWGSATGAWRHMDAPIRDSGDCLGALESQEVVTVYRGPVPVLDPASVLAALLAESPDATVAAIEALLTTDEVVEAYARAYEPPTFAGDPSSPYISEAMDDARRGLKSACRSLLSKAPKEDDDA
jgi:hypothetical protein